MREVPAAVILPQSVNDALRNRRRPLTNCTDCVTQYVLIGAGELVRSSRYAYNLRERYGKKDRPERVKPLCARLVVTMERTQLVSVKRYVSPVQATWDSRPLLKYSEIEDGTGQAAQQMRMCCSAM